MAPSWVVRTPHTNHFFTKCTVVFLSVACGVSLSLSTSEMPEKETPEKMTPPNPPPFKVFYSLLRSLSLSHLGSFLFYNTLCINKERSKVNGCGCVIPNPTLTSREGFGLCLHHVKLIPGLPKTVEVGFWFGGLKILKLVRPAKEHN